MREIKFKAKRLDNGKWAYGYGVIIADDFCVLDKRDELQIQRPYTFRNNTHWFELCGIMCDTNTLSQFTGLHDKNGKEIYEGDIVRFPTLPHKNKYRIGYIGFHQLSASFRIVTKTSDLRLGNRYGVPEMTIDVIGNIHDNPELLKQK